MAARRAASAASAANAALDHARALYQGADASDPVSLCVLSSGQYDVPDGIVTSFPCATDGKGNWKVVDDFSLDTGRLRFRAEGSPGGHNGLKSIQQMLGTDAFPRLRLGIG